MPDYAGSSRSYIDSGLTAGQEYIYQVALLLDGAENRRSNEASVTLSAPLSFGDARLSDYPWHQNLHNGRLDLPEATGGVAPLTYSVSPDLPAGLVFDPNYRTINGIPTEAQERVHYTYTVTDANGDVGVDPASLTFTPNNWQSAQTVTVSAAHDPNEVDDHAVISHGIGGETVASFNVSVTDDDSDWEILRDFYQATGGDGWTNNDNWMSDNPLRYWHGVTTDDRGQVTHLSLRNNGLSGSLPSQLGKMEALQVLSLDRNSISGNLPTQLGNLSNLTRLSMNRNSLTGAIPSELGNLSNLSIIGLARNQLSGSLPASLGNLTGLTKLSRHDNTGLSGALPSGFTNLANLQRLAIANTGLCAPDDEAFDDWLDTVSDKPGGVDTCEQAGTATEPTTEARTVTSAFPLAVSANLSLRAQRGNLAA